MRKHAGVTRATVWAKSATDHIVVTVTDHGGGFDASEPGAGFGIRESIVGRLRQAGGSAEVTSAPGEGTQWTLSVPL
ncbi:hypothetical protein J5X84_28805 [Streptosporangiaceae bacterium NEAU-GS5]|nr:hypothetical protein [Streptosporangiaceae bacterium NEAU-GS5]